MIPISFGDEAEHRLRRDPAALAEFLSQTGIPDRRDKPAFDPRAALERLPQ